MNDMHNLSEKELSDEVELSVIFRGIWRSRNFIIITSIIGAVFSVFYALSIQNTYKSEVTILIESQSNNALLSQYSSVASMAGLQLGNNSVNKKDEVMQIMLSREFINNFVNDRGILVPLFAFKKLSPDMKEFSLNEDIYNQKNNAWVEGAFLTPDGMPSYQMIHDQFLRNLTITEDFKTGFINMAYTHPSPSIAQEWLSWLIEDINAYIKNYDIHESQKALDYLEKKLINTKLPALNKALTDMAEEELRRMMLINIKDEYLVRTIDPAIVPIKKFAPSRASICIIISSLTFILSLLLTATLSFFRYCIIIKIIPPKLALRNF